MSEEKGTRNRLEVVYMKKILSSSIEPQYRFDVVIENSFYLLSSRSPKTWE